MEAPLVVDVHGLRNFTEAEKQDFITKVLPLLQRAVNSDKFENKVKTYSYGHWYKSGPWWRRRKRWHDVQNFKRNNGYSREYIYHLFKSGVDLYNPDPDHDLDLFLTAYYTRTNTIGYTYPSTYRTWVNRKYFGYWLQSPVGRCNIVGNIIHEYMHNLGFGHSSTWNSTRKHTVPYAFGYIARDVAKTII